MIHSWLFINLAASAVFAGCIALLLMLGFFKSRKNLRTTLLIIFILLFINSFGSFLISFFHDWLELHH